MKTSYISNSHRHIQYGQDGLFPYFLCKREVEIPHLSHQLEFMYPNLPNTTILENVDIHNVKSESSLPIRKKIRKLKNYSLLDAQMSMEMIRYIG